MSSYEEVSPEVIAFEGVFSDIPDMHDLFRDDDINDWFRSDLGGESQAIKWFHSAEKPEGYQFVPLTEQFRKGQSYTIYDLNVDEEGNCARLYVIRFLGDIATGGNDEVEAIWHELQVRTGMVLPNSDEIRKFKRLFIDFYISGA